MNSFLFHARTSWKTTVFGVIAFLLANSHQILDYLAFTQGYVAAPGAFDWKAFAYGLVVMVMGASARDADKTSEDHNMNLTPAKPTDSALLMAALKTATVAALMLTLVSLTGCAGIGNQDPSLNAALDGARARVVNYKTNRDTSDAVEDAALADAQMKAIAQDTQVSVLNAQTIATQKNLPVSELAVEIGRIYAAGNTDQIRVAQNLQNLKIQRAAYETDINNANALIAVVETANASKPVTTAAAISTAITALTPSINGLQTKFGISTSTPAPVVNTVVQQPATMQLRGTVATPVPAPAVIVPQPLIGK